MLTLRLRKGLVSIDRPAVMGIVNVTPDSFYAGSRSFDVNAIQRRVESILVDGADIIDIGACSSRPGADDVPADEELERLARGMHIIRSVAGHIPVSVDTFRARVAETAVTELGCDIVNDISGGTLDDSMASTVARLHCPYILMHMRGNPATMHRFIDYPDGVTAGVIAELARRLQVLNDAGVSDVIIDPGFGFAKTLEQNYTLMRDLRAFEIFGLPVLVGISRKSMITGLLDISADDALDATTALNSFALERGAALLRVHDVRAARHAVDIFRAINSCR